MKNINNSFKKFFLFVVAISVFGTTFNSCSILNTIQNLQRLKFKLNGISDFKVSGVSLAGKSKITDFGFTDALKLKGLLTGKSFPVQFIVDVAALNPNDGKTTPAKTDATINNLDWRLLLDDVPTISGDIAKPVSVPSSGQSVIIPLTMNLDLYQFFSGQGLEKLLDLALAIGGQKNDLGRVKLDVKPTVNTMFGPISYPSRITVIDKDFTK